MSKRDDILVELTRRLRSGLNNPLVVDGEGGIWGLWGGQLPCVHIFEDATQRTHPKPGVYQITLPIQIEYVSRLSSSRYVYEEGRRRLVELQTAIELDERFAQRKGLPDESGDLAISYWMTADEIVEVVDGVVDVAAIYNFVFTEQFLGYERDRH